MRTFAPEQFSDSQLLLAFFLTRMRQITPSANLPYKAVSITSDERLSFRGRVKRGTRNPALAESATGFRVRCFQLTAFAVGADRPGMTMKGERAAYLNTLRGLRRHSGRNAGSIS